MRITSKTCFISADGGVVDFVDDASGEVLGSVSIPPGRISARAYLDLAPRGSSLHVSKGLIAVSPKPWAFSQDYGPGSHESGANPDFQPTSATRFERQMRFSMARLQALDNRIMARAKALDAVERIPAGPGADPVEDDPVVIEADDGGADE